MADDSLRMTLASRIEPICQRFEASLRKGEPEDIERLVEFVDPNDRESLRQALSRIEFQHRHGQQVHDGSDKGVHPQDDTHDAAKHTSSRVESPASESHTPTLSVRCPNCRVRIELPTEEVLVDIHCSLCGARFNLALDPDETREHGPLRQIAHFRLVEPVGKGAFGMVWKAYDSELDRIVALKVPRKERLDSRDLEQFLREARSAAQLRHPNILRIHEVGRDAETVYIVSEFIRGASLAEWLEHERFSATETALLFTKLADALQHAHDAGVVHRDLKPANILIDEVGEPHITDSGLAKREAAEVTMTLDGQIVGTPAYMSPEQARGEAHAADPRTDVYSLGVVMFQLLTGELPFRGSLQMLIIQIINDEPPAPRKLNAHIPRDLETICLKSLSKEPSRRYATAKEMADDLGRFLRGEPVVARPLSLVPRLWLWCHRRQRIREAGLAMVFLVVALASWAAVSLPLVVFGWVVAPTRRFEATLHLCLFAAVIYPLMFWIGIQTLNNRLIAISAGMGLMAVLLVFCLAMLGGLPYDFGGLYVNRDAITAVFSLSSVLSAFTATYYAVALIAYLSNRNALRWSREAKKPGH